MLILLFVVKFVASVATYRHVFVRCILYHNSIVKYPKNNVFLFQLNLCNTFTAYCFAKLCYMCSYFLNTPGNIWFFSFVPCFVKGLQFILHSKFLIYRLRRDSCYITCALCATVRQCGQRLYRDLNSSIRRPNAFIGVTSQKYCSGILG